MSGAPVALGPIQSLSGRFHVIFGDAPSGSGVPAVSGYVLVDDQGQATELLVQEQMLRAFGGRRALNHRQIAVTGQPAVASIPACDRSGRSWPSRHSNLVGPEPTAEPRASAQAATGPQPWATILCRFGDSPGVTPHPLSWFNTLMLGTSPPGLDHYWRELSFNNVNLTGSAVYGWYTLPQPRSYYVSGNPGAARPRQGRQRLHGGRRQRCVLPELRRHQPDVQR